MTLTIHKEVNRFMWILKGHLVPDGYSEQDYLDVHDAYFKRLWGNMRTVSMRKALRKHIRRSITNDWSTHR